MRTFDCRVVFVDEVTLDELDCEAALSHSTASYHHQLVFPEELRRLLAWAVANGCCGVGGTYFGGHCVEAGALCDKGGVRSRMLGSSRSRGRAERRVGGEGKVCSLVVGGAAGAMEVGGAKTGSCLGRS